MERRTCGGSENCDEGFQDTYQERNATKNPDHEKKKVRPYLLSGFRIGIERALRLMGLTSGASQRCEALKPIFQARLGNGSSGRIRLMEAPG